MSSQKKILIIQQDDAYFLFETLRVLEKDHTALKDFVIKILVNPKALAQIQELATPWVKGVTTDVEACLKETYDLSFNLSMNEDSWDVHAQVQAEFKHGPEKVNGELMVADLWSTFLLTLKAQAPFLTFHLQDIYRNILGIKGIATHEIRRENVSTIAFGFSSASLVPVNEQEDLIHAISKNYPLIQFKEISEVDILEDLTRVLYIGPPSFESLTLCESGARGIFLSRHFTGFNLLPYDSGHVQISSQGKPFSSQLLQQGIFNLIQNAPVPKNFDYPVYSINHEELFGAYLKNINESDEHYPVYQAYVVLWNFLLSMCDTNLDIHRCTPPQAEKALELKEILTKLSRLHDYALSSIDTIHQESKSQNARAEVIAGHVRNLQEIDSTFATIAQSHSLLRPILDFYRIRKGQNAGDSLKEQSQNSLLTYSEENQALKALDELFNTILAKT